MLLDAIPDLQMTGKARTPVAGEVPNPLNRHRLLLFNPRCQKRFEPCDKSRPGPSASKGGGRLLRNHRSGLADQRHLYWSRQLRLTTIYRTWAGASFLKSTLIVFCSRARCRCGFRAKLIPRRCPRGGLRSTGERHQRRRRRPFATGSAADAGDSEPRVQPPGLESESPR